MNIDKIEKVIEKSLRQIEKSFQCKSLTVMSSLAIGADTLIVRQVLKNPYSKLIVPLPLPQADYEMDFATEEFIGEFRYLLSKASEIIVMPETARRNESYESAGKYVLENCDVLLTIWDGQGAQGQGGTGEIVALARERKMPIAWIHAGNRKPGTQEPTSLGNEQGKVTFENFP